MIRSPWAREYARTPNAYIWGTEASSLARQVSARLPAGARVLDLGYGEGHDLPSAGLTMKGGLK